FLIASSTADCTISIPITLFTDFAIVMPMVPVPQQTSNSVWSLFAEAHSAAILYKTSAPYDCVIFLSDCYTFGIHLEETSWTDSKSRKSYLFSQYITLDQINIHIDNLHRKSF